MNVFQKHLYHLVDLSSWPLLGSLRVLTSTIGGVMYMHSFVEGGTLLSLGLGMILYTMFVWWHNWPWFQGCVAPCTHGATFIGGITNW